MSEFPFFRNFYGIYITHLNTPNNSLLAPTINLQYNVLMLVCVYVYVVKSERKIKERKKNMIWHNQRIDEDNKNRI